MTIAFIIATVVALVLLVAFLGQNEQIKELKQEASTYKIVAEHTDRLYRDLKNAVSESASRERLIHAEYCTSDSDMIKYKTEKLMESAITSKLAMLVGHDIQKWIAPRVTELEGGKKKYSFVFKIRGYDSDEH